MTEKRCPTPRKARYESRSAAARARGHKTNFGKRQKPYLCPCGYWHLATTTEGLKPSQKLGKHP